MTCRASLLETFQLRCIFPTDAGKTSAIAVYFSHDVGQERRVVSCVRVEEELDCNNESGFSLKMPDSTHAQITFPEGFEKQSGNFRCQIPGYPTQDFQTCQWPPLDGHIVSNTSSKTGNITENELYSPDILDNSANGNHMTIPAIVGVVLGALILIAMITASIVLIRRKVKKNIRKHVVTNCEEGEHMFSTVGLRHPLISGSTSNKIWRSPHDNRKIKSWGGSACYYISYAVESKESSSKRPQSDLVHSLHRFIEDGK